MSSSSQSVAKTPLAGRVIQIALLVGLFVAWYAATNIGKLNPLVLPSLQSVWSTLVEIVLTGRFIPDLLVTLGEIVAALAIASVGGLAIGYACSRTGFAIRTFDPLFASLYAIPSILFYPLLLLLFGIGPASKIAMGVVIAIFPIIMATIAGFSNVERIYKVAARSMGADNRQMFFSVLLPAALPVIASGLRIGTLHAKGGILAAEALGSQAGLGHQIVSHADQFQMPTVYAYIVIAIIVTMAITITAFVIENRINKHAA